MQQLRNFLERIWRSVRARAGTAPGRRRAKPPSPEQQVRRLIRHVQGQWSPEKVQILERACEFGCARWPIRVQRHVRDRDVLEVGAGSHAFSVVFRALGARSYTGLDFKFESDNGVIRDKVHRRNRDFGMTRAELVAQFDGIRFTQGDIRSYESPERYDVVVMNDVTEHIMGLDDAFRSIARLLRPGGHIVFRHHNYYSWNGHHGNPVQPRLINPDNPRHQRLIDWGHVRDPGFPADHYISRALNKIRPDELRELTERYFEILEWNEQPSSAEVKQRLTPEIEAALSRYSRRELTINGIFCVARPRN